MIGHEHDEPLELAPDWQAMSERLASENAQLRGVVAILASRLSDNYFGAFTAEQIERALEETNIIHHNDGSVTITPGMGS
jgi:hypothetical protein